MQKKLVTTIALGVMLGNIGFAVVSAAVGATLVRLEQYQEQLKEEAQRRDEEAQQKAEQERQKAEAKRQKEMNAYIDKCIVYKPGPRDPVCGPEPKSLRLTN